MIKTRITQPHPPSATVPVSLRLGHARGKTIINRFLTLLRRYATQKGSAKTQSRLLARPLSAFPCEGRGTTKWWMSSSNTLGFATLLECPRKVIPISRLFREVYCATTVNLRCVMFLRTVETPVPTRYRGAIEIAG